MEIFDHFIYYSQFRSCLFRPTKKAMLEVNRMGKYSSPGRPEIYFFAPQEAQQSEIPQADYALSRPC